MDALYREFQKLYVTKTTSLDLVEELFRDLGNPLSNDKLSLCEIDELDSKYRRVLQSFLDRAASSSPPDHPYFQEIKTAARQVLECNYSLHHAFVERLAHIAVRHKRDPLRPYEHYFFWICNWVYQGRKVEKLALSHRRADQSGDKTGQDDNNKRDNNTNAGRIADGKDLRDKNADGNNGKSGDHDGPDSKDNDDNSLDTEQTTQAPDVSNPPESPTEYCANCGAPDASLVCRGCTFKMSSRSIMRTVYCSPDCQAADLPFHGPMCLRRLQLVKSVLFMRTFMYVMIGRASTFMLKACWEEGDVTMLKEGIPYRAAMQGEYMMRPFRCSDFPQKDKASMVQEDEFAREMIYLVGHLKEFVFDELCLDFKIFTVLVKNANQTICRQYDHNIRKSNMMQPHYVFQATLPGGEKFAVDLSPARYGWKELVLPWDEYVTERIWRVVDTTRTAAIDFREPFVPAAYSVILHKEVLDDIIDHAHLFMETVDSGLSPLEVLTGVTKDEFRYWDSDHYENAHDYCRNMGEIRKIDSRGYMYLNPDCELQITTRQEDHDALANVWLSEEEARGLRNESDETLKAIWRDRIHICRIRFKRTSPQIRG
ncbi:hypothetical protein F4774DRAFT_426890 [Daldinia eschscholtzii]|nr:hypothetical protein F4774DRAFT_426890 [Daldinia eschscholtzii]